MTSAFLRHLAFAIVLVGLASTTFASEARYRLNVLETGVRDYYCTLTVQLENMTDAEINDINGHFVLFSGDEAIAEGRAASFTAIAPGATGSAVFLAPNEPCDEIDGYAFRMGACRVGGAFEDLAACASWFTADAPIREVAPR